jgi:hypothetical protein
MGKTPMTTVTKAMTMTSATLVHEDVVLRRLREQDRYYLGVSRQSKLAYQIIKVVQLIAAGSVTVTAALHFAAPLSASLGALIVILEGVQQLFQFHATWIRSATTAMALERTEALYHAATEPFDGPNRLQVLARQIETICSAEVTNWAKQASAPDGSSGASK